ncbi:DUF11 domain-containing protein [Meiothermus rufus]|uniref:DUF11 domain-containing protein n=1 Tax=Meiothermus rufus TaxID=604332 RepID=UPI000417967B|nr:DUF11 domain-containing protein [Meiothermus rufus]
MLGAVWAQQTPAGTNIANQASASYIDSAGQPRTTTSNQVITVVQQVYSFSITPDGNAPATPGQTRSGLPGAPVYFSYTVSNTGNGSDTINLTTLQDSGDAFDLSGTALYLDANCNGTIDPGETTPITSVTLSMGQSACVILAGTIPPSATNGQFANINLQGASAGSPSVTDTNNWARAVVSTAATLTATKAASPSGAVAPGSSITYTISGANTGGSAAQGVSVPGLTGSGILVADVIPSGLVVSAMPTGSAGAGTVSFVYTINGTTWSTLAPGNLPLTGNGTIAIGMFIGGSGAFFPQTASYTFSFSATVPASAPAGTTYTNSATVRYNNGTDQTATTNSTHNTVAASYSVAVGPYAFPLAGASGSYTAGGYSVSRSGDTQTIASANSGSAVVFRHTLRNTGNTSDSFSLGVSGAPSGWVCTLLADDLSTPISGPVGPIAAGADYNFALRCTIPASYTSTTPVSLTVTATSQGNPSQSDTTTDTVSAVVSGYSVDAAHNTNGASGGEPADPANDTRPGYNPAVNPGGVAYFPFEVSNTGANPDTYNFTSSLPAGWSVVFYPDANCDGVMDTPTPAPVNSTGLINAGATACFIAAVQVPVGAAPVDATPGASDNVSITVTSTTLPSVSDTIFGAVDVNLVAQISLEPNRSGTATTPGTIQYTHTLTNLSNADATCNISGDGGSYGWTYQYSTDGTNWYSALGNVFVAANGGSLTIYVRVIVPAGQPIGRTDVNTVTATCSVGSATASDTATETTTVVGGELSLSKSAVSYVGSTSTVRSADGSQAYPGDQIVYTVVAQNIGTGNLTQVILSDPLPAYTTFVSASASASGFSGTFQVLYSTDGTTWSTTAPSSLAPGQSLYVAVDTNSDSTITTADVMPPGASITITFRVQVQ